MNISLQEGFLGFRNISCHSLGFLKHSLRILQDLLGIVFNSSDLSECFKDIFAIFKYFLEFGNVVSGLLQFF